MNVILLLTIWSKTSGCVHKPAPLQGSFSPGTDDEAAVTAPHCPVSVFGGVWLTLYWRGLIAHSRSSASHVTFSFMLQRKKLFGCPIC